MVYMNQQVWIWLPWYAFFAWSTATFLYSLWCDVDYQQDSSAEYETSLTESSGAYVTCSTSFYVEDGICVPACDEWEQDSHQTTITIATALLLAALMSLAGGTGVIIGSIIRRKSM